MVHQTWQATAPSSSLVHWRMSFDTLSELTNVLLAKVEIGCEPFTPEQVAKTVAALKENPPACPPQKFDSGL